MRRVVIAPDEHYHIFNRGNNKARIFLEERDYVRFLFLVLFLQSPRIVFSNIRRSVDYFMKYGEFDVDSETTNEILRTQTVELVAFILMPNHYHLILRELEENGISHYLLRVQDAYTKYFNIKYGRSGHLFQGPYGAVRIEDNNQLLYLSTYIHRNALELPQWKGKEHQYPWSSYKDYLGKNDKNQELLKPRVILDQFPSTSEYRSFVNESTAKINKVLTSEFLFPASY